MLTSPGVTTQPRASITSSAGPSTVPTARIAPSSIRMSPSAISRRSASIVTIRAAFRTTSRAMIPSRLDFAEFPIGLRSPGSKPPATPACLAGPAAYSVRSKKRKAGTEAMKSDIGLIGLGTMGAALSLNIAEKGFGIAVFNRTGSVTDAFVAEAGDLADRITPCASLEDLVAALKTPRAIILMVPAGPLVDQMIATLRPMLDKDDLIIDCGNANFQDTRRRSAEAEAAGSPFLGVGVSGGEEGARHGPSIMGGGPKAAWDRVAPILEAISAKFDGQPCATWMGPDGAGHFVKTVHNGIEYADMQMIAEVYGIMRDGLGMEAEEVALTFDRWNRGPLRSYLIEITGIVAKSHRSRDRAAGHRRHPRQRRPEGHRPLDRDRGAAPRRPRQHHRGRSRRAQPVRPP